jgi:alpha-glucosidase (family GH31 glycosyl hydrolase)
MMTFFQQNGVKIVCWFTPFINTSSFNDNVGGATPGQNTGKSPNYDFAANNGYFVKTSTSNSAPLSVAWWKGTGSPVDFTNPAAKTWFTSTQLQPLVDGSKVATANSSMEPVIGGFKTDDGEALDSGPAYIPTTASYFDGRTGKCRTVTASNITRPFPVFLGLTGSSSREADLPGRALTPEAGPEIISLITRRTTDWKAS